MNNFCPNCGTKLVEGQSCPNCGGQQAMPQMPQIPQVPMQPVVGDDGWKNTKATVGLVLGIVSFFIFGFLAFFGLAFGISGLNEAKQHNGKGKGVATAAVVVGAICSCLVILNVILAIAGI